MIIGMILTLLVLATFALIGAGFTFLVWAASQDNEEALSLQREPLTYFTL